MEKTKNDINKSNITRDDDDNTNITNLREEAEKLLLQRNWFYWVHKPCYDKNYDKSRALYNKEPINTISSFWKQTNNVPKLSTHFWKNGKRRPIDGIQVEGWSFFQSGISPDWEDIKNRNGNTITFKSSYSHIEIENIWQDVLLILVGESIPDSEHIVGARVIDRGNNYRVEIWIDEDNPNLVLPIRDWFLEKVIKINVTSAKEVIMFLTPHSEGKKVSLLTENKHNNNNYDNQSSIVIKINQKEGYFQPVKNHKRKVRFN